MSTVDCGSVPFTGGKTVAEVVLDVVSGMNPNTVCGVIDVSLGVINAAPNISEFFTELALNALGCPGDEVFESLQALDGLAKAAHLMPISRWPKSLMTKISFAYSSKSFT